MFAGIIEEIASVLALSEREHSLGLRLSRPQSFDDLSVGDSIACNGVCLTIEEFDQTSMQFTIGFETLQVTGWTVESLKNKKFHVERSLAMGQRIHGHLVSGHVDATCLVKGKRTLGDCLVLNIELPKGHEKEL